MFGTKERDENRVRRQHLGRRAREGGERGRGADYSSFCVSLCALESSRMEGWEPEKKEERECRWTHTHVHALRSSTLLLTLPRYAIIDPFRLLFLRDLSSWVAEERRGRKD